MIYIYKFVSTCTFAIYFDDLVSHNPKGYFVLTTPSLVIFPSEGDYKRAVRYQIVVLNTTYIQSLTYMNPMGGKKFSLFMKYNFKQEQFNIVINVILKITITYPGVKCCLYHEYMFTFARRFYEQHSLKLKNFKIIFVSLRFHYKATTKKIAIKIHNYCNSGCLEERKRIFNLIHLRKSCKV